jgi:ribosomal protein S26
MGFYKRGWHHTKTRGRETTVTCGFCGRMVPKYKAFSVGRGFRNTFFAQRKMYACPGCARHRNIVRKKR